jgi:cobalt-zinc-cadmium efflux system membrane fusion protein
MTMRHWTATVAVVALVAACGRDAERQPPAAAGDESGGGERVTLEPEALKETGLTTVEVERRAFSDEIRATAVIKPNESARPREPAHSGAPSRCAPSSAQWCSRVSSSRTSTASNSGEEGGLPAGADEPGGRATQLRAGEGLFKQRISSRRTTWRRGEFERSDAAYRAARSAAPRRPRRRGDRGDHLGRRATPLPFPILAPFGDGHRAARDGGRAVRPEDEPYTIADLSTLWILLDVYEKDLGRVAVGKDVEVRVDAFPEARFHGQIAYLSQVLDESTRTARARVEVDNQDGRLRPGMFATAIITLAAAGAETVVVVPEAAIQRVHGKPTAFVEESPGSYQARPLSLGRQTGGVVEVAEGLAPGERVVTDGAFALKSVLLKDELAGED